MPVPAIIAAAMAAASLVQLIGAGYSAKSTIRAANYNADYTMRGYRENTRYWDDYFKNTGFKPRYPVRSGSYYNLSALYSADSSRVNAINKVINAGTHVGVSGAYGLDKFYGGRK